MADIKLGPLGSETTLPEIKYPPGSGVEIPTDVRKNVDEAKMLDGSARFNIASIHPRSFTLEWDELPWSDVQILAGLCLLNEKLNYINGYTDNVGFPVVVLAWGYVPIAETTGQTTVLYKFTMELKGTGGS